MTATFGLFAAAPRGLADLLAVELREQGATELHEYPGGVHCRGDLATAYRACLWSRVASRVLLELGEFDARDPDELYAGVRQIDWSLHLGDNATLACEFTASASPLEHSHYATLRVKDAIVDQLRERRGTRPSIDTDSPDVLVHVHAQGLRATVSIDLAGDSLHRRGYRARGVAAPLKENLAAGVLLRSAWPKLAAEGAAFLDPMCGSGSFVIEAALIACNIAPGLLRERFGFSGWSGHDAALWQRLRQEAEERRHAPLAALRGYDHDPQAVHAALSNIEQAGLRGRVHVERRALEAVERGDAVTGLLCTNPPYGERLGEEAQLRELYSLLGRKLREEFVGWQAAVLTGNPELGRELKIRARRNHTLWNGAIECRLLRFSIETRWFETERQHDGVVLRDAAAARARPGAEMFANRLRKNLKELGGWAAAAGIFCYRVYDADMPEYAFAIDLYQGFDGEQARWLYVQEYAPPATVDPQRARMRRDEALSVLPELFGIPLPRIHMRTRRRQRGSEQYEKRGASREFKVVNEDGLKFLVNFSDYLDTGLFLDHRPTRRLIRELARERRFLNLFAYTGAATVHAAAGGARASTTIDMSRPYLDWARRNLELNGFGAKQHQTLQADCVAWLAQQAAAGALGPRYGLIFLDPPTFSNSKRMQAEFDVQRDHVKLIRAAAGLLTPDGVLLFSTNFEDFRPDLPGLAGLKVEDWTAASIPRDFQRHRRIHHSLRITR